MSNNNERKKDDIGRKIQAVERQAKRHAGDILDQMGRQFHESVSAGFERAGGMGGDKAGREMSEAVSGLLSEIFMKPKERQGFFDGLNKEQRVRLSKACYESREEILAVRDQKAGIKREAPQREVSPEAAKKAEKEKQNYLDSLAEKDKDRNKEKSRERER